MYGDDLEAKSWDLTDSSECTFVESEDRRTRTTWARFRSICRLALLMSTVRTLSAGRVLRIQVGFQF